MRTYLTIACCVAWAVFAVPSRGGGGVSEEYRVKAGFIYNFIQFVEWPASAFSSPHAPLVLGIYGKNPFGEDIQQLAGRVVKGHPLEVRMLSRTPSECESCHVVFFPLSEQGSCSTVLSRLRRAPVLTIGESAGFARAGGVINFYLRDDRVAFEINPDAARRSKMDISSRLLKLARIVEGGGP